MTIKTVNIKTIRIDGGTQPRESINMEAVGDYAEGVKAGIEFPPVVVFHDGAEYWLADGFHRYHAHVKADRTSIAADLRHGTLNDAKLFASGANGDHGLRRTNVDKRLAVLMTLGVKPDWSDHKIAAHVGVSQPFVSGIRTPKPITVISRAPKKEADEPITVITPTAKKDTPAPESEPKKPALAVVEATPPEDEYTELDDAHDQIEALQSMLAVASMGSAPEEDKEMAKNLIAELRAEIKTLQATIKAITRSRDEFQNENAQLRSQIQRQRREIDRATGRKTA